MNSKEDVRPLPDAGLHLSTHYDRSWREQLEQQNPNSAAIARATPFPRDRYEACRKYFPALFRAGRILELGAGPGFIAKTLLTLPLEIDKYTVTEFSDVSLEVLRKTFAVDQRVEVRQLDAERLDEYELEQYDAILLVALIEHFVDPLAVMRKVSKLLRPGGFVYIDTPNVARYTKRLQLLFGRFPSTASRNEGLTTNAGKPVEMHEEGHLHYFTFRSLSLMLTQYCGFSSVKKLPYFGGRQVLPAPVGLAIARLWPEMFSELALAAFV